VAKGVFNTQNACAEVNTDSLNGDDDANLDSNTQDEEYANSDADQFRLEQLNDSSLKPCWDMAKRGKGGFTVHSGLLYHTEYVACVGNKVDQSCLPFSRRKPVIELVHCTIGCHQAFNRTRDCICLTFYWPTLTSDTKTYCSRCETCQKKDRVTVWDRMPIVAVPRAQYVFQEFYVDCTGPLFPNQKRRHIITLSCSVIQLPRVRSHYHYAVYPQRTLLRR